MKLGALSLLSSLAPALDAKSSAALATHLLSALPAQSPRLQAAIGSALPCVVKSLSTNGDSLRRRTAMLSPSRPRACRATPLCHPAAREGSSLSRSRFTQARLTPTQVEEGRGVAHGLSGLLSVGGSQALESWGVLQALTVRQLACPPSSSF